MLRGSQDSFYAGYITRDKFLDRLVGEEELHAFASLWCGWHAEWIASRSPLAANSSVHATVRFRGFGSADAPRVCEAIGRAVGGDPPAQHHETIQLTVHSVAPGARSIIVPWALLLATPELNGLCIEVRLVIENRRTMAGNPLVSRNTLILWGLVTEGRLLVKAIWPVSYPEDAERIYRHTVWDGETDFIAALDSFLPFSSAPATAAMAAEQTYLTFIRRHKHLFGTVGHTRAVNVLVRFLVEAPRDHGLGSFLARLGLTLGGAASAACLAFVARENPPIEAMFVLLCIGALILAQRVVWAKMRRIVRYKRAMSRGLGKLYAGELKYEKLDKDSSGFDTSPTGRKYTSDLLDARARHGADFKIGGVDSVNRLFLLEDGCTYCLLGMLTRTSNYLMFPARPVLMLVTDFEDGHRLATTNGSGHRRTVLTNVTNRCLPYETNVAVLMDRHAQHVERLRSEGRKPSPADVERYFVREREVFEETRRRLVGRSPYTWGDALHEGFKMVRREYRD